MLLWTLRYMYPLELVLPFFSPRYILRSGLARLPLCFLNGNFWWTEILNFDARSISHFFSFSVNAFYVLFEENLFLPQDMKIFFLELFFLAVLHLPCCTGAFFCCSDWGLLLLAVYGLLIVVVSSVVEHRLTVSAVVVYALSSPLTWDLPGPGL